MSTRERRERERKTPKFRARGWCLVFGVNNNLNFQLVNYFHLNLYLHQILTGIYQVEASCNM